MSKLYNYAVKPSQQPKQKKHLTENLDNNHYSVKISVHVSLGTETTIIKLARKARHSFPINYIIFSKILIVFFGFRAALKILALVKVGFAMLALIHSSCSSWAVNCGVSINGSVAANA